MFCADNEPNEEPSVPAELIENPDAMVYDHDYEYLDDNVTSDPIQPSRYQRLINLHPTGESTMGTSEQAKLMKWHRQCGHMHPWALRKIAQNVPGMEELLMIPYNLVMPTCEACLRAKSKLKPKSTAQRPRTSVPFRRWHINLSGNIKTPSFGGAHYFMVVVDEGTNYKWVYALQRKKHYLRALDDLILRVCRAPEYLRADGAGEFNSKEALRYYERHKIWKESSAPYTPHQNGRSENAIGSLSTRARTMLVESGVPKGYWPAALHFAAENENRCLPYAKGASITPYDALYRRKPDNSKLAQFSCKAYMHVRKGARTKWDDNAIPTLFLGFSFHLGIKSYLLASLKTSRIYISTNVTINEGRFPYLDEGRAEHMAKIWGEAHNGEPMRRVSIASSLEDMKETDATVPEITVDDEVEHNKHVQLDGPAVPARSKLDIDKIRDAAKLREAQQKSGKDWDGERGWHDLLKEPKQAGHLPHTITPTTVNPRRFHPPDPAAHTCMESLMTCNACQHTIKSRGGAKLTFFQLMLSRLQYESDVTWFVDAANEALDQDMIRTWINRLQNNESQHMDKLMAYLGVSEPDPKAIEQLARSYLTADGEPESYAEALQHPDKESWVKAVLEELHSLESMKAFKQADLPHNRKAIPSRIVFKIKVKDGIAYSWKARIVAKGFKQQKGVDYVDTYSAMAHPTNVRLLLAMAAAKQWWVNSTNIKLAYITAPL